MNNPIYLDNNATTRIYDEALEEVIRVSKDLYGNPSSAHKLGQRAKDVLEVSREKIANLLNVLPEEIIFTGGGSESNNLALKGLSDQYAGRKDHIISSIIEHSSVYHVCQYLEKKGNSVTYLKPDSTGKILPENLESAITDRTFLVSIMYANNETGTLQDIRRIGEICKKKGLILHSDGVQAFGKVPIDLRQENIGLFSTSAHKIHGPKGVGFLYKRRDIVLTPLIHGGGQENNWRSGTENVPLIAGFAKACEIKFARMKDESRHLRELTTAFVREIKSHIPFSEVNGDFNNRIPNTVNVRFPGTAGPKIISYLNDQGIFASPSSACTAHSEKPSRILLAMGLMTDEAFSSIRFSFDATNTMEEVHRTVAALKTIVAQLME
jgi:cysteine desulfurase